MVDYVNRAIVKVTAAGEMPHGRFAVAVPDDESAYFKSAYLEKSGDRLESKMKKRADNATI